MVMLIAVAANGLIKRSNGAIRIRPRRPGRLLGLMQPKLLSHGGRSCVSTRRASKLTSTLASPTQPGNSPSSL